MKKFFVTLFAAFVSFTIVAGTQFVPKDYVYEEVAATFKAVRSIDYTDLFEYPDSIPTNTDLTSLESIDTIFATVDDESIATIYDADYWYSFQKKMRIQINKLASVKGSTTVRLSIVHNGDTVTSNIAWQVYGVKANTFDLHILPDAVVNEIDVLKNSSFYMSSERATSTITIDNLEEITCGKAEVINRDGANDVISFTPNDDITNFSREKIRYTITLPDGEQSSGEVTIYIHKNSFATKLVEYQPAPGQFRTESWDIPSTVVDDDNESGGVSLGGFGGYIVLGFDQPIYNNPQNPYGVDFSIKGNSFIANVKGVWTEPGAVQVMEDKNGNGKADDGEWYELAGSDYWLSTTKRNVKMTYYNPHYNKRYTVPWTLKYTDEQGKDVTEYGALLSNQFHSHTYYPDYFYNEDNPNEEYRWYVPGVNRDSVSFVGTLIRSSIDMRAPSYIEFYRTAGFGYCDNKGYNKNDLRIAQNPYGNPALGEAASDGFDLNWAVDKDGNYVDLEKIDFVKIYTAGSVNAGWLGEWSTEVLSCAITTPDPDYVQQDYYMNYVGITQLQVVKGTTCQYQGFLFKNGRPVKDAEQKWWITDADGNIDDTVASIDNTGLFTAKEFGTAYVHFTAMDGLPEETFEVTVGQLTSVLIDIEGNASTVSNDSISTIVGERIYINVQSTDECEATLNGTTSNRYIYDTYTWENSNPEVGSINNGTFIALTPGETILTVKSNTDNTLTDQIKVTVNEIPEIVVLQNPIMVPYNEPVGDLLNNAIFSTGNDATVYMDEVTAKNGFANISLYNNHLNYAFTEGEYGEDLLHFKTTCYGVEKEFDITIIYGPDNFANKKQLLLTDNTTEGINTLAGVDIESYASSIYVNQLGTVSADDLLSDGAYAYITQGNAISRYEVANGNKVAEAQLSTSAKHFAEVYKDKIFVSDGNTVKAFYKTDLVAYKTIEFTGDILQMTLNGDVIYAYTNHATDPVEVFDINTWATPVSYPMDASLNIADLYVVGSELYMPIGATETSVAKMYVVDYSNYSWTVKEATETSIGNTNNISVLADSTIMVSSGNGFVAYNLKHDISGLEIGFGSEIVMNGDALPKLVAGESYDVTTENVAIDETSEETTTGTITETYARFYVVYEGEATSTLKVFETEDLSAAKKEISDLCVAPTAINLMAATNVNSAPTVKKATSTYSTYELATSQTAGSWMYLTTVFADTEGNTKMYVREDEDWLSITYYDNGNLRPYYMFAGTVDKKTVYSFPVECIDDCGASAMAEMTITVTPRIYAPAINEVIVTIDSGTDPVATVAVTDVFVYTQSTSNLTFTTDVTNISDAELITSAVVDSEGNLVITVPENSQGNATIELTQTITHKTYGSKTFVTEIPVLVDYNLTDGIEVVEISKTDVYYANGNLYVNDCFGQDVMIYDISGKCVATLTVDDDSFSAPLILRSGIYIVTVNGCNAKIVVK